MHPILFQIHHFFIGTYGLFVALGLLIGLFAAEKMGDRHGVDRNLIMDLVFIGVLAGIFGARLTFILVNFSDFRASFSTPGHSPWDYVLSRQGFVFGGGIIGGILASVVYIRLKKGNLWNIADVFAPAMPLGHAFGRIGCFFAGCCWGKRCELPWAVSFPKVIGPNGEILGFAYQQHVEMGLIPPTATQSLPVHPVQLYESAGLFLLSLLLFWAWKRRKFEGQIFLFYLMGYPILRFFDEFFRGDSERGIYGPFSTSQYLSMGAFAIGIILWVILRKRAPQMETAPLANGDGEVATVEAAGTAPASAKRKRRR